jgi:hypothetical protein
VTAPMLAACAALLLRAPGPAPGFCSCAGPATDYATFRYNTVVFEGRPTGSRVVLRHGYPARVYTFSTTRWRKGMPRRSVEVETGMGGSYTLYARRYEMGRLGTDICSGPYGPPPAPPSAHFRKDR